MRAYAARAEAGHSADARPSTSARQRAQRTESSYSRQRPIRSCARRSQGASRLAICGCKSGKHSYTGTQLAPLHPGSISESLAPGNTMLCVLDKGT